MDAALTPQQRAVSHAYKRMIDEALYWALLYSRWADDAGWAVLMPEFFGSVPGFLRGILSSKIRKDVVKKAYDQGIARHSKDEIYDMARKDLEALSVLLGDDQWFFGADKPGTLDIWCHANVINIIRVPIENKIKQDCLSMQNLCDHAEQLQEVVYPELCDGAQARAA